MAKYDYLNKLLKRLDESPEQGVISSNSEVRPFKGVFEGEYYARAYCICAGKIVFVGSLEEVEQKITDEINEKKYLEELFKEPFK
jgi:ABC-type phosphate/phosphonate transport system ATPase subunit